MDLFSQTPLSQLPGTPLAERMRPRLLSELVGQPKIQKQIEAFIQQKFLPNLILWGPPGCGKTTLARILSLAFDAEFLSHHAVDAGAKSLKDEGYKAAERRRLYQRQSILFIDEIHRLNKAQQDVLLPFVESGDLTLVGATTENPSYELNRALLSRSRLLVFEPLSESALKTVLERALGAKREPTTLFNPEGLDAFVTWADGDARRLLSALEEVLMVCEQEPNRMPLAWADIHAIVGSRPIGYDKKADQHYDVISAFIKSTRGSDADAALYWLARMIRGGEDPVFIARRLVILASEDIGNADPRALSVAVAAAQAVEMIGWPEARINLAQATTYLALAPKSNRSYLGINQALEFVDRTGSVPVPLHLRSSKTTPMKEIGYGKDYLYPHDHSKGWVAQTYGPVGTDLPPFYEPSDLGFEKSMAEYQRWRRKNEPSNDGKP
jgi:putative ATPase